MGINYKKDYEINEGLGGCFWRDNIEDCNTFKKEVFEKCNDKHGGIRVNEVHYGY